MMCELYLSKAALKKILYIPPGYKFCFILPGKKVVTGRTRTSQISVTWDPTGLGPNPATTPCVTLDTSCPSLSFYLQGCKLRARPESISRFSKSFCKNQLQVCYQF